jgi:dolichyldiphosphatase
MRVVLSSLTIIFFLCCLSFSAAFVSTIRTTPIRLAAASSPRRSADRIRIQLHQTTNGEVQDSSSPLKHNKMFQTIGKTTSMVVAGTFFAVLAYQRDALMLCFFLGAILNGILSKVLKKLVNQERPEVLLLDEQALPPSDNGMPSSHAMSLGFICTFTALQLPYTTIPLLLYVFISLWYRVETKLHTLDQVLVGLVLGTLDSFLWRSLCFGTNPFFNNRINIMDWVTSNLLNEQGVMPIYALTVPAIVGALVVGSVERRIQRFLQNRLNAKQE